MRKNKNQIECKRMCMISLNRTKKNIYGIDATFWLHIFNELDVNNIVFYLLLF